MKNITKIIFNRCLSTIRYFTLTRNFGQFGAKSTISKPLRVNGPEHIFIGEKVGIHKYAWLGARNLTGYTPSLIIKDNVTIGDFAHIFATRRIEIGCNVLLANNVYISDNVHGYVDVEMPVIKQPIIQKNDVFIGEDSWIGEHVSIIGSSIGKHCVIGANSVVTHNIPDYCVAVGIPARIIKRYDFDTKKWRKTNEDGEFK